MKTRIITMMIMTLLMIGCGGGGSTDNNDEGANNAGADADGDGIADVNDPNPEVNAGEEDDDGDGIANNVDLDADLDGDGIPNAEDDDVNGDGVSNAEELDALLAGTYDIATTVTETNCGESEAGATDTSVLTLGLSEDGSSLTGTILDEGDEESQDISLSGWVLGSDFTLSSTSTQEAAEAFADESGDGGPEGEFPEGEMPEGEFPEGEAPQAQSLEGCQIVSTLVINGTLDGDALSGTIDQELTTEPEGCAGEFFTGCTETSTLTGTRHSE